MKKVIKPLQELLNWAFIGGLFIALPMLISRHWQEANDISLYDWVAANLGLSVVGFVLVTLMFVWYLVQLQRTLKQAIPSESSVQHFDSMSDTMVSLSFGVGVIWTAIGMRNALVNGLTGVGASMAESGDAFAILERLVDGGILVALSTTIVGGVLGYLLRVAKSVAVGRLLYEYYRQLDNVTMNALTEDVAAIRQYLVAKGDEDETLTPG